MPRKHVKWPRLVKILFKKMGLLLFDVLILSLVGICFVQNYAKSHHAHVVFLVLGTISDTSMLWKYLCKKQQVSHMQFSNKAFFLMYLLYIGKLRWTVTLLDSIYMEAERFCRFCEDCGRLLKCQSISLAEYCLFEACLLSLRMYFYYLHNLLSEVLRSRIAFKRGSDWSRCQAKQCEVYILACWIFEI